jgi:thioesterase domain-containing protein
VAELADRLGATGSGAPSVLVSLRDGPQRPPLFLLHPSGGEVIAYRALLDDLAPGRALVGVRSPAVAGAPERGSVAEMAGAYATALREHQPEGPYLLGGWSLGGVLAQAMAAELEREGGKVALCALIDSALPAERPELLERTSYRLGAAVGPLAGMLAGDPADQVEELLELPEGERLDRALSIARERGEAFAGLARETLEREIALAGAHARVLAEHRPATVRAPLRVFWAEGSLVGGEPPTDWGAYTGAGITQSVLPGAHHYSVLEPPTLGLLCAGLTEALEAAVPTNVAPD